MDNVVNFMSMHNFIDKKIFFQDPLKLYYIAMAGLSQKALASDR